MTCKETAAMLGKLMDTGPLMELCKHMYCLIVVYGGLPWEEGKFCSAWRGVTVDWDPSHLVTQWVSWGNRVGLWSQMLADSMQLLWKKNDLIGVAVWVHGVTICSGHQTSSICANDMTNRPHLSQSHRREERIARTEGLKSCSIRFPRWRKSLLLALCHATPKLL